MRQSGGGNLRGLRYLTSREQRLRLVCGLLEALRVELLLTELNAIPVTSGLEYTGFNAERGAKRRDIHLDAAQRSGRGIVAPNLIDETASRERRTWFNEQCGQQGPLLPAAERYRVPVHPNL